MTTSVAIATALRLNLGSGGAPLAGYTNIDRCYHGESVRQGCRLVEGDVYPLTQYADGSVDEVRASHVLEHIPWREGMDVLREWVRVLKPGGVLKVAVPDFRYVAERFLAGEGALTESYVMGGQTDVNDYHRAIFDEEGLRKGFAELGLTDIDRWTSEAEDCASLPVSLNLMGRKSGELVPASEKPEVASLSENAFMWLGAHQRNVYSQYGEDGVLQAIFAKIGCTNRWCCECGAADGTLFSNTRRLIDEEGFSAVLVEADPDRFAALEALRGAQTIVGAQPAIRLFQCQVTADAPNTLDDLLDAAGAPEDLDLLVIDVDGQDYYLLLSLMRHHPRIVMCEFDPFAPSPDFIPAKDGTGQAGANAIIAVGYARGYRPVVQIGPNIVFVQTRLLQKVADRPLPFEALRPLRGRVRCCMSAPRLGFMDNMFSAIDALIPHGVDIERSHGVFWGQCLSRMMEHAIEEGFEYILTTDYDTVFTADDVAALARIMDTYDHIDAVCSMQKRREDDFPLFSVQSEDGRMVQYIEREKLEASTIEVKTAHFGLTILRTSSLARCPKPWFLPVPDEAQGWGNGRCDEDMYFWRNWCDAGLTIHQANRVVVGHMELMVSFPGRDLKPVFQPIKRYGEVGKPGNVWR